jgi:hypothetical protein
MRQKTNVSARKLDKPIFAIGDFNRSLSATEDLAGRKSVKT